MGMPDYEEYYAWLVSNQESTSPVSIQAPF